MNTGDGHSAHLGIDAESGGSCYSIWFPWPEVVDVIVVVAAAAVVVVVVAVVVAENFSCHYLLLLEWYANLATPIFYQN